MRTARTVPFIGALGLAAAVLPAGAAAKPHVSASPSSVAAGGTVSIAGRGFAPGRTVAIQLRRQGAKPTSLRGVKAGSSGRFRKRARIPAAQAPGRYLLVACQSRCRLKATTRLRLTVQPGPGGAGGGGGSGGSGGGSSGGGSGGATILAGPGASSLGYLIGSATTSVGGPVSLMNLDVVQHDVTADQRGPDGAPLFSTPLIGTGQAAQVVGLDRVQAGQTYGFFCSLHANMRGQLIVQ